MNEHLQMLLIIPHCTKYLFVQTTARMVGQHWSCSVNCGWCLKWEVLGKHCTDFIVNNDTGLPGVILEDPFQYLPLFLAVRIGQRKPGPPKKFIRSNPLQGAARQRASPACWARPSPPSTCSTPAWALLSTWSLSLKIPLMYLRPSPFTATTLSSGKTPHRVKVPQPWSRVHMFWMSFQRWQSLESVLRTYFHPALGNDAPSAPFVRWTSFLCCWFRFFILSLGIKPCLWIQMTV